MGKWVPETLAQLQQYPDDRFWGLLFVVAIVIVVCTWIVVKYKRG